MPVYSVNLDWLAAGQIGMYDMPDTGARIATKQGWNQRCFGARLLVSNDMFTMAEFRQFVQDRLAEITEPGHIIATFTAYDPQCDAVVAGLAFYPNIEVDAIYVQDGLAADVSEMVIVAAAGIIGADVDALPAPIQEMYRRAIERREETELRWAERLAEEERCDRRADALLLDVLSTEQTAEYTAHGYFHVTTNEGLLFRLHRKQAHNVELIHNGIAVISFCIVGSEYMPTSDQTVAQKLLLEACPDVFIQTANRRRLIGGDETEYYRRPQDAPPIAEVLAMAG